MIQIKKQRPSAVDGQGRARGKDWWDYYRPHIQSVLSHPEDVASFTVIAAMIRYPAESCSLVQNLKAADFTSTITRQLGKGCLFELNGYGCVRVELMFRSVVSDSWNQVSVEHYQWMVYQIPFHADTEVVKEVIRGAVRELKHERFCTNRRFK
jgi:hypothetical protein